MNACDVCGQMATWEQGTTYTADEFRELVSKGFEPVSRMRPFLSQARVMHGLGEKEAIFAWKNGLVKESTTDWLLCSECASDASRYVAKPRGTGPSGAAMSEPITPEMLSAAPSMKLNVVDYHSRGQEKDAALRCERVGSANDGAHAALGEGNVVRVTCCNCQRRLKAPAEMRGKIVKCPNCGSMVGVLESTITKPRSSRSKPPASGNAHDPLETTTESFKFRCSNCQRQLRAKATMIGKRAPCPGCDCTVEIPDPRDPEISRKGELEVTEPKAVESNLERNGIRCCSCRQTISESAVKTDLVGDFMGMLGAMTGGQVGNVNPGRKTMPDILFGGAMKCNRCESWMCCSCAEERAKAQGATHAELIASQATGVMIHSNCEGIFERP